ncbi:ribokinase [Mycobacterium antarcticum]|uniref:ribokinase n=1 Tax=unclassified Mycolicibacterium TaxID=2636767 RepID=UPI0024E0E474|nr:MULTISPECIES: ribokinase [unclassified Mycolicibacterium]
MARVCVIGSVNLDQSFAVARLPQPGETVLASSSSSSPGGKGGNQAVAAARAGASVQLVAAMGDDAAASRLRSHLHDNDVGLDGTVTVPGPSGAAAIVVDATAENVIVVAPGANEHLSMASAAARRVVSGAEVVLLQLEIPMATVLAGARLARDAGALVIVNASPSGADPAALAALAQVVDVVVVNDVEAAQWRWPVEHLVVTRGAAGARYQAGEISLDVPAPPVEAVDTTGAGDVFAGVLAAEWLSGPERALRRACAAGALATLTTGAGDCAPTAEAIDDVLDDDQGDP